MILRATLPNNIQRPRLDPRIRTLQAQIAMQSHTPTPRARNIRREIADEETLAQQALHHTDSCRMSDQVPEYLVQFHEVENSYVAGVGVEMGKVGVGAAAARLFGCFPEAIEHELGFFRGEDIGDDAETICVELVLVFCEGAAFRFGEFG